MLQGRESSPSETPVPFGRWGAHGALCSHEVGEGPQVGNPQGTVSQRRRIPLAGAFRSPQVHCPHPHRQWAHHVRTPAVTDVEGLLWPQTAPFQGLQEDAGMRLASPCLRRGDRYVDGVGEPYLVDRPVKVPVPVRAHRHHQAPAAQLGQDLEDLLVEDQGEGFGGPVKIGDEPFDVVVAHLAGTGPGTK